MDSVGVLVSQGRAPCRAMSNHVGRLDDGWWAVQAQTLSDSHSVTRDEAMSPIQSSAGQPRVTQPRSLCCLSSPRAALS